MTQHGSVPEFHPSNEDWISYTERVQHYFTANDVTVEEKKRSILLSNCGATTYKLIRSLVDADRLNRTSYKDLVKLVQEYYAPAPSVIVQRFKFNTRVRSMGESVAAYVASLRQLAEHCGYGESLHEMLRDRLVCGVNHDGIQRKLLAEKNLTYDKAYELAVAVEAAERDTKDLKLGNAPPSFSEGVHYSTQPGSTSLKEKTRSYPKKATPSCYRCGGEHLATVCRYRETICRYCKKKGHLERVCRTKLSRAEPKRPNYPRKNCYIDEDQRGPDPDAYDMFTLTDKFYDPIIIQVTINGVPIKMEMDTGASVSVISKATYQMISSRTGIEKLQESTVKLKTYTGEPIPVLGTVSVKVSYNNCELELFVQVVDGKGPDLMGRDWLTQFKVALRPVNSLESLPH